MFLLFKKIDYSKLPKHIAFIMDGNGRWAKKRNKDRNFGHSQGVAAFERVVKYCFELNIKCITFFAFSTENWKRSNDEVNGLLNILRNFLNEKCEEFIKANVKLNILGDISKFPKDIIKACEDIVEKTKKCNKYILNLALNYGARDEILHAANRCIQNKLPLTAENFEKYLFTAGQPDPDLIIRTSGEIRLSNFLLYQAAYSELYFTKTLWPSFSVAGLKRAILIYQSKSRRFGGVK